MAVDVEPAVTMADLRKACEDRLDYARTNNEPGFETFTDPSGDSNEKVLEMFETPAGLSITRYAGQLLVVECDFGAPESGILHITTIEFSDQSEQPEVTERTDAGEKTVARRDFNRLAAELSKYVTLVV